MHELNYAPAARPVNLPWLSCFFLALLLIIASALARAADAPHETKPAPAHARTK